MPPFHPSLCCTSIKPLSIGRFLYYISTQPSISLWASFSLIFRRCSHWWVYWFDVAPAAFISRNSKRCWRDEMHSPLPGTVQVLVQPEVVGATWTGWMTLNQAQCVCLQHKLSNSLTITENRLRVIFVMSEKHKWIGTIKSRLSFFLPYIFKKTGQNLLSAFWHHSFSSEWCFLTNPV